MSIEYALKHVNTVELGLLIFLIANVFLTWKYKTGQIAGDTIDLLNKRLDAQKLVATDSTYKIEALTKQINDLTTQIALKDTEVKRLLDLNAQRDPQSKEITAMAIKAMQQVSETLLIVKSTNENVEKLYTVIEKHLKLIETKMKEVR
jgi:hypothetical protein